MVRAATLEENEKLSEENRELVGEKSGVMEKLGLVQNKKYIEAYREL